MTPKAIACTLTKKDLAGQARRWRAVFAGAGVGREAVADGLSLHFRDDAGVEDELQRLVAVENECCSWADWRIAREQGMLAVVVRSDGEGVAALHGMFIDLG